MADPNDFTRLAELLISRQDQQQQQLELLREANARTGELQARQQQQTDLLLEKIDKTDAVVEALLEKIDKTDALIQALSVKTDKTDAVLEAFGQVQNKLINQLELIYNEQQRFNGRQENFNDRQEKFNDRQEKFNERQEKFNERQDQFNIIFLDEIRGLKKDVKMLIEVVMQRHEERLKRLEDFMDGFLRKAG